MRVGCCCPTFQGEFQKLSGMVRLGLLLVPQGKIPSSFLHFPPVRERPGRLARSLYGQLTIQGKLVPGACGPAPSESVTNTPRSVLLGVKAQHEDQELLKQRPHGHDRL